MPSQSLPIVGSALLLAGMATTGCDKQESKFIAMPDMPPIKSVQIKTLHLFWEELSHNGFFSENFAKSQGRGW